MKTLLYSLLLSLVAPSLLASEKIQVWNRIQDNPVAFNILKLALNKTISEYGSYTLVFTPPMEQSRAVKALQKKDAAFIVNMATNPERERMLQPIRIPVTQGLLGYRVCLIKKGNQGKFSSISSLADWQQKGIVIGQGQGWPDTQILKANQLSVMTSPKYHTLFKMLDKRRFDCFARSLSEVSAELESHPELELENRLLLVYRLPTFLFVNKHQKSLAERLQKGLESGYQDGSIQALVQKHYQSEFDNMNVSERTLIPLDNPYLSEKTAQALANFKYWYFAED